MPRIKTFHPNFEKVISRGDPSWRIRRATELYAACFTERSTPVRNQISKWIEGEAVYRYVLYLKAKRWGYVQERLQRRILQKYIDIQLAQAIEAQATPERLELRLRILAGESFPVIARKMKIDEKVVRTYCCYYFDVYEQRRSYLLNLPRPSDYEASAIPVVATGLKKIHLEYYCYRRVDFSGPVLIERLVELYTHYGQEHDLGTKVGRRREGMEVQFESRMLPRPATHRELLTSFMLTERLRKTSSYLDAACNVSVRRSVLQQLFKNTVPTPVIVEDFDSVAPRKSPVRKTEAVTA